MVQKVNSTCEWLKSRTKIEPEIGIVLGTGLGHLAGQIEIVDEFPYGDIPNFPVSTVEGHHGRLLFGHLGGKKIMALDGRFHFYEGYSMKQVTFPIRVMQALGVGTLFVSNAAGGLNQSFQMSDIMLITDHINFFPEHPLNGPNYGDYPRFPDMHAVYDRQLLQLARDIAKENGFTLQEGVYMGVQGPTFETPAEFKMFWRMGADAVGMSTVPEVIVARHGGMRVFGISIITDMCVMHGDPLAISHEEVQQAALVAQENTSLLFREVISRM